MKAVDLTNYKKDFKEEYGGSSNIVTFLKDGKEYYFKRDFKQDLFYELSNALSEAISEVFSSYFLEKMGAKDFVKYDFAFSESGEIGTLSQSFLDSGVIFKKTFFDLAILDSFDDRRDFNYKSSRAIEMRFNYELFKRFRGVHLNSVEFVLETIESVSKKYNIKYDKEDFRDKLIKMAIYDYFMSNEDRNMSNIIFLVKQKDGVVYFELAPLFDFGLNFGVGNIIFDRQNEKHFFSEFGLSKEGQEIEQYLNNKWFKDCGIIVSDIRDIISDNKEYKDIVQKCLNIDIGQMLDNFEKDYDFKISKDVKDLMVRSYNIRVERFKKFEQMLQKRIEKANKIKQKNTQTLLP